MTKKKEGESEDQPTAIQPEELSKLRHGIVLTGGIDSTVLLHHLKNNRPDIDIYPIFIGDLTDELRDIIKYFLDKLGITQDITAFGQADEIGMLTWAEKHQVSPVHFAANHDEGEHSIINHNFDYFQKLNDHNPNVVISTPFMTVTKSSIIQMAIDKYDIDLSKTAEPSKEEKDLAIRAKAFKEAFSVKNNKWIEDPFAPKPNEDKK